MKGLRQIITLDHYEGTEECEEYQSVLSQHWCMWVLGLGEALIHCSVDGKTQPKIGS